MKNFVLWFTGLSGSGKSTLANEIKRVLEEKDINNIILDGDIIRNGLNKDLGFSDEDRHENIRRISEVCKLFLDVNVNPIVAFISPFAEDRSYARNLIGENFIEIYCKCSIEKCEKRDVKGLYAKVRKGEISRFTGITSPYEEPIYPDLYINTDQLSIEDSIERIIKYLWQD